jgi:hypothetical protein
MMMKSSTRIVTTISMKLVPLTAASPFSLCRYSAAPFYISLLYPALEERSPGRQRRGEAARTAKRIASQIICAVPSLTITYARLLKQV